MFVSNNCRIIKSRPSGNHRDQYFEKFLRKTTKFFKNLKNIHKNFGKTFITF